MKIVISQPHGNQNTSEAVKSLEKFGLLDSFWTTIAFPFSFKIKLKKIRIRFLKEIFRRICIFLNLKKFYLYDENILSVHSISRDLDFAVSKYMSKNKNNINAIYTYEDCALNSFRFAKKNNIKTIYDLTAPYWLLTKKILKDELNLQPKWNLSSTEILNTSSKKCANKNEEILLSDQIIVASSFTARSLELLNKNIKSKIKIVPYGITCPKNNKINKRHENEELKIIFAGRLTLSKGIQYLIKILQKIDFPWKLEIAGSVPEKPSEISEELNLFLKDPRCIYLGQIPNKKLVERMKNNHLFVFPSLFDGFGQVILEALSCSLPIITTNNTGASDIIDEGQDGFLTPIRDISKSVEILNKLYQNEDYRQTIAENAFLKANNFTWSRYQNEIKKIIEI